MDNTELWNKVFATEKSHTKGFSKAGGFKGTAIKPYWLIHQATIQFGACGIGWGWREIENKYVGGVWCSRVELWYVLDGKKGTVEQWGQTVMEGRNKNGDFVDEEAPKKAVTDAVTKCLSYLGFGGDVHMGLFDDSKYVGKQPNDKETATARNKRYAALKADILASDDPATLWHERLEEINEFKETLGAEYHQQLIDAGKQRKAELEEQAASFPQGFNDGGK